MFCIVREKSFDEQIKIIARNYSRMGELDQAIDWALCRKPTRIPNIVKVSYHYYLWVTDEFYNLDIPMVRILYMVDQPNKTVYLLSICEVMPKEEEVFSRFK
jgi:hypothetical protein